LHGEDPVKGKETNLVLIIISHGILSGSVSISSKIPAWNAASFEQPTQGALDGK
jgi:hypothetical protein